MENVVIVEKSLFSSPDLKVWKKMIVNSMIKQCFIFLGGERILRFINQTPRILFWHGVSNNPHQFIELESIDTIDFKKQIEYLNKYFNIISMDEFYQKYIDDKLGKKDIILTFDDGYKNNLQVLVPIMNKLNLPITVFITTNNITTGNLFPTSILRLLVYGSSLYAIDIPSIDKSFSIKTDKDKLNATKEISNLLKTLPNDQVNIICTEMVENISKDEYKRLKKIYKSLLPLNWDEVRELKKQGVTIGSHCMDHICCHENQSKEIIKYQISESKKIIEKELNIQCDYFAYPNGNYTNFSNTCVEEANYKLGFSTKKNIINFTLNGIASVPRISVPYNINTFKILTNLYPKRK
jgi:peptidoglycan/xylan/chitin deacetylase (PgdA/CDA1 family)